MAESKDLRAASQNEVEVVDILLKQWPSVPGRDTFGTRAALDCAAILLRTHWAKLVDHCGFKLGPAEDQNAFTKYVWANYGTERYPKEHSTKTGENTPYTEEEVNALADAAIQHIQQSITSERNIIGFRELCRGHDMITALWQDPTHQLVFQPYFAGPRKPDIEVDPITPYDLARAGFLKWDGVTPATLKEVVAFEPAQWISRGVYKFSFPRTPILLQVNFDPREGSVQTLETLWAVETPVYEAVLVDGTENERECRQTRTQWYSLVAAVGTCANIKNGPVVDMIRVFADLGHEHLPWIAKVKNGMPSWTMGCDGQEDTPLKDGDVIRPGVELTLFYRQVPRPPPAIKLETIFHREMEDNIGILPEDVEDEWLP